MPQASDPKLLSRLARLELRARTAVEGLAGGLHRSPIRGSSSTFAEHREYTPGDDLRRLDWRVIGRTDRNIVREYEEETDLTGYPRTSWPALVTILFDATFRARPNPPKKGAAAASNPISAICFPIS